jgi:hypothetical protein
MILGCTLWSAFNPKDLDILLRSITNFKRVDNFDPETFTALHQADVTWLNETVAAIARAEPERKVVIFTHHTSTVEGTGDPRFTGQLTSSAQPPSYMKSFVEKLGR